MATCRSCSRGLDPSWKFCVYCGTPASAAFPSAAFPSTDAPGVGAPAYAMAAPPAGPLNTTASSDEAPFEWTSSQPSTWPGAPVQSAIPSAIRPDAGAPERPFSVLAIVAFVLAVLGFAPAFVLGHIALGNIRSHGLRGAGLAIAATVIGYVMLVLWIAGIVAATVFLLRSDPAGTIQQTSALLLMRP